jgi:hypothetical protein
MEQELLTCLVLALGIHAIYMRKIGRAISPLHPLYKPADGAKPGVR